MTRRWRRLISWGFFTLIVGEGFAVTGTLAQNGESKGLLTEATGISLGLLFTILGLVLLIAAALWDTRLRAMQAMPNVEALEHFVSRIDHDKAIDSAAEQNRREHTEIKAAIERLSARLEVGAKGGAN